MKNKNRYKEYNHKLKRNKIMSATIKESHNFIF